MLKIAFDFDDVLFQTSKALREESIIRFGFDCLENCKTYNLSLPPGINPKVFVDFINEVAIDYWDWIQPYSGAVDVLTTIFNQTGNPIPIVTSRHPHLSDVTKKMLDKYLSIDYIIFFTDNKCKVCIENNIDVLVDDRYKIIVDCAPFLKKAIMPNRQWNIGRETKYDNIVRIDNIKEVLCLI